jgi:Uma2 family endonuclease
METLPKQEQWFTYADYKDWQLKEGERFEVIYGEVFAISAPNARHQMVLTELISRFHDYLQEKHGRAFPAPYDVRLFFEEDESDDTIVQPDIVVVCDEKKRGPEGCRGAPDLIIEILSPQDTAIGMQRKFNLYRQAGVREYWVVDPVNNGVTVYLFDDDEFHNNSNRFLTEVYERNSSVPVTILSGFDIPLEQVFAE